MPLAHRCVPFAAAVAVLLSTACDPAGDDETAEAATLPEGCNVLVEPSARAQTEIVEALVAIEDGQTLCLGAGRFSLRRQLTSLADDITIRGAGMTQTILDFSEQVSGANGVLIEGDRNVVEDLAITGTPGDGIRANDVDGIVFQRLDVGWDSDDPLANGAYAIYPVQSTDVIVRDCVAHGARDAGIYLGQSTSSLLENNEAFGNVIGVEVENSTDTLVVGNHAHDNTNGLLVITLPGLDIGDGKRANARGNVIENNNVPNFGDEGTVIGVLPRGIGVLLVATDHNEVWDNDIRGNGTACDQLHGAILVGFK